MSQPAIVAADLSAERQEHRYVLAPERGQAFARALNGQLPPPPLPRGRRPTRCRARSTSSRPSTSIPRRATPTGPCARQPARRAATPSCARANITTCTRRWPSWPPSARDIVRRSPGVWLELKFRDGKRTGKRRLGIPEASRPRAAVARGRRPRAEPPSGRPSRRRGARLHPRPADAQRRRAPDLGRDRAARDPRLLRAVPRAAARPTRWCTTGGCPGRTPRGGCGSPWTWGSSSSPRRPTLWRASRRWCARRSEPLNVDSNER